MQTNKILYFSLETVQAYTAYT